MDCMCYESSGTRDKKRYSLLCTSKSRGLLPFPFVCAYPVFSALRFSTPWVLFPSRPVTEAYLCAAYVPDSFILFHLFFYPLMSLLWQKAAGSFYDSLGDAFFSKTEKKDDPSRKFTHLPPSPPRRACLWCNRFAFSTSLPVKQKSKPLRVFLLLYDNLSTVGGVTAPVYTLY